MIVSILDNDLYKFSMQQAVAQLYPRVEARYKFTNRGGTTFPLGFSEALRFHIYEMEKLYLTKVERTYLEQTCPFFTQVYLDLLEGYRYNADEVTINEAFGELSVSIEGPWYRTILWEVPLMAMISELYFQITNKEIWSRPDRKEYNQDKARALRRGGCKFFEFGTRRRYSRTNQAQVLHDILGVRGSTLAGTSNVEFARQFGIKPAGTMAHEWIMFHAADSYYPFANQAALSAWFEVYGRDLATGLPDTFTTPAFFKNTGGLRIKQLDALRQDSGDPRAFTDMAVDWYEKHGVDPATKEIVFSDSLNASEAAGLQKYCDHKGIKCSFGIGTYLSNDVKPKPLNMVIKLSEVRMDKTQPWQKTVKLSDTPGKHTGDPEEIAECKKVLGIHEKPRKIS